PIEDGLNAFRSAPAMTAGSLRWAGCHRASRVHACALGDLVDDFLIGSQAYADDFRGFRVAVSHDRTICCIVTRGEHLFDVQRMAHAPLECPTMHVCHCLS